MKRSAFSLLVTFALLPHTALLAVGVVTPVASSGTTAKKSVSIAKPGKVTMRSRRSVVTQGAVTYIDAHMTTDTGATLDADSIRAEFHQGGGTVDTVIASGHVRAFVPQAADQRQYTVYADKGVFLPKQNQIVLTGAVKTVIDSSFTDGPLVQTGDTATVQLGNGPNYPVIEMTNVETNFSIKQ